MGFNSGFKGLTNAIDIARNINLTNVIDIVRNKQHRLREQEIKET